jgi:protocatechuate 3,4-dioxygenase beta subunit
MFEPFVNRRDFLKQAAIAAAVPWLASCGANSLASGSGSELDQIRKNARTGDGINWTGASEAPDSVNWRTTLASPAEPGEHLTISGTVYQVDGRTPAPNVLIYLYHTDINGYYGRGVKPLHGRHRGWMLTGPDGRYEFTSIKPAAYPERKFAAHVHMTLTTRELREDSIDSILFEGDPLISQQERATAGRKGGFNPILTMEKGTDGLLRGTRNIQLIG